MKFLKELTKGYRQLGNEQYCKYRGKCPEEFSNSIDCSQCDLKLKK